MSNLGYCGSRIIQVYNTVHLPQPTFWHSSMLTRQGLIIGVQRVHCWCSILLDLLRLLLRHHGFLIYEHTRILTSRSVCRAGLSLTTVLVGNKADLSQDRKVTTEEARQWAKENDVTVCVESSAKSGDGVEDAFQRVAEEVFRKIRDGVFDLTDKVPSPHEFLLMLVNGDKSQSTEE